MSIYRLDSEKFPLPLELTLILHLHLRLREFSKALELSYMNSSSSKQYSNANISPRSWSIQSDYHS